MNQGASHLATKGTPSSCRKGMVFKGNEGVEKRKLLEKKYYFRHGCSHKGNRRGLSVNYLVMTRKFQVNRLKVMFLEELKLQLG